MNRHAGAFAAVCMLFASSAPAEGKPTAKAPLPTVAKAAFVNMMRGTNVIPQKGWVTFSTLSKTQPIKFSFKAGQKSGVGYALRYKDHWVFSAKRVTTKDLTTVTKAMVSYLKENFFVDSDATPAQIAKYCKAVRPERTFWPTELSDPYNLVASYPVVFCLTNPTGTDHGFFVGYNPKSHATEAYDFN